MNSRLLAIAGSLCVVLLFAVDYLEADSRNELRIQAALEDETNLEFIETPLSDVVTYLSDLHDVPVLLDVKSLQAVQVATDSTVTLNVRGVPFRSGLNHICRSLGVSWMISDDALMITSLETMIRNPTVRIYDVRELAPLDNSASDKIAMVVTEACDNLRESSGPVRVSPYNQALVVTASEHGHFEVAKLLHDLKKVAPAAPLPIAEPAAGLRPRLVLPAPRRVPAPSSASPETERFAPRNASPQPDPFAP